jgi:uncharacterized membrane protein YkoI
VPTTEQENKMTYRKIGTLLAGIIALSAAATAAYAYKGEQLAPQAKIGLEEARQIALKAFAGDITDEELERERGGSGLRYSFDIKNGSVTHEVGVDAKTGQVLENSVEHGQD